MAHRLTIWTATINGEQKLSRVLPGLREVADQLVVGIDDATTDDSARVAGQFADKVIPCPHGCFRFDGRPDHVNPLEFGLRHCDGDWVLRVDHDETLGPGWKDRITELMSNRAVTHYWISRRWAVPPGDRFISSDPWHPDYQVRLYRNLPSLIQFTRHVHRHTTMLGEPRWLTREWLIHWDLVWHTRIERQAKVDFCASLSTYTGADYYLYEDRQFETLPLDYVPAAASPRQAETGQNPLGCAIEILERPEAMRPGERGCILAHIRNLSPRVFHPGSAGVYGANVLVSYHWHREDHGKREAHQWDHARSELPGRLLPGEDAAMYLRIEAPPECGDFWLQADLVEEGVAWASSSVEIPAYRVTIRE